MSHNYKLTIAYDGTAYCGWQIQPNGISIQELLQSNISILTKEPTLLIGSGRTDAGVHARGQVANFHTPLPLELNRFHYSLNSLLPKDIRVLNITEVPQEFHSRYSAKAKTYHYHLGLGNIQDPFDRLYCTQVHTSINISLLKEAARLFIGTHDFRAFANEAHKGSAAHDSIRTLYRLDVIEYDQNLRLEFEGDGFLYKMVRNIVGTLIEVASGKKPLTQIPETLAAKDRRTAGQAAPAAGLFLMHVTY
jgi:tRNA pseudouridine38-40 synthase